MSRMYHSQLEQKLDSALSKVPSSYICNRCKGRGHFVSDCPTNEDPKYDITAGFDYVCKFCKQRGTHYFLFCPRNPDPNSIHKRRQLRSFQRLETSSLPTDPISKRHFLSPSKSLDSPESATLSRSENVLPNFPIPNDNLDISIEMRRTSSPDTIAGRSRKNYCADDMKYYKNSFRTDYIQDGIAANDECSKTGRYEIFELSEGEVNSGRQKNETQGERSVTLQKQSRNAFSNQSVFKRTMTEVTVVRPALHAPYAEFLNKLLMSHSSQPNQKGRPRMTAMKMWEIEDEKKCYEAESGSACLNEGNVSSESCNQINTWEKIAINFSGYGKNDSMDIDTIECTDSWKTQEEQVDFLISSMGFEEYEEVQDKFSVFREEKVRAIQKRINSIEDLRTKLASGEDVELPKMEQIAKGVLSQANLDEISGRMRVAESPSSPSRTSSSSELSSRQRLSSSSCRVGNHRLRTE